MATTPEGAVKKEIRNVLNGYQPTLWYYAPVQNGMGAAVLDFIGAHNGRAFAIEAKAPGKSPTARQLAVAMSMGAAGMRVFLIDSVEETKVLRAWLNGLIE